MITLIINYNYATISLGGMPFLFWKLIEESKARGAERVDFGRSDLENKGLITFKDRFGTSEHIISYYRFPGAARRVAREWNSETVRQLVAMLPNPVCGAFGRIVYRHMG